MNILHSDDDDAESAADIAFWLGRYVRLAHGCYTDRIGFIASYSAKNGGYSINILKRHGEVSPHTNCKGKLRELDFENLSEEESRLVGLDREDRKSKLEKKWARIERETMAEIRDSLRNEQSDKEDGSQEGGKKRSRNSSNSQNEKIFSGKYMRIFDFDNS